MCVDILNQNIPYAVPLLVASCVQQLPSHNKKYFFGITNTYSGLRFWIKGQAPMP